MSRALCRSPIAPPETRCSRVAPNAVRRTRRHNEEGRLSAALFVAREPAALSRSHVIAALGQESRGDILAGRPGADKPDGGATVCACLGVGVNTIRHAIAAQGLTTVEAIGKALGAGTNCGSCRPELKALLGTAKAQALDLC